MPLTIAAAPAASVAAASAPLDLPPSSQVLPYPSTPQPPKLSYFPPTRIAASTTAAAAAAQWSHSQSQAVGLRAVTLTWPRPLPSLVSDFAAKPLAFATSVVKRSWRALGVVVSPRE